MRKKRRNGVALTALTRNGHTDVGKQIAADDVKVFAPLPDGAGTVVVWLGNKGLNVYLNNHEGDCASEPFRIPFEELEDWQRLLDAQTHLTVTRLRVMSETCSLWQHFFDPGEVARLMEKAAAANLEVQTATINVCTRTVKRTMQQLFRQLGGRR